MASTLHATARLDPARPGFVIVPGASGRIDGDPDVVATIPVLLARFGAHRGGADGACRAGQPGRSRWPRCAAGRWRWRWPDCIDGRHATTHHLGVDVLEATGAIPVAARVVDDGDLVSAGGVTSGLDLALHLLHRSFGPRIALAVEQMFAYERRGTGVDEHRSRAEGVVTVTIAGDWDVTHQDAHRVAGRSATPSPSTAAC